MKSITYGNLKQKYEKKKTYLMHYQLLEHRAIGFGMLKLHLGIYVGCYLFLHNYPLTLASLDFSFTVLSLVYLLLLKPGMLKGQIPAYYRRDYNKMGFSMFLIQFFIQGGLIRTPILALYYAIVFYLVKNDPREVAQYKQAVTEIMINPVVNEIAIGAFLIALYLLFYHERYTSIREFSNAVVEIYSSNQYTEEEAVQEFIYRKDHELELINIDGVKYDGEWAMTSPSRTSTVVPEPYSAEPVSLHSSVTEVSEEPIVRRKARNKGV